MTSQAVDLDLSKLSANDKKELQQFIASEEQKAIIQSCALHSLIQYPSLTLFMLFTILPMSAGKSVSPEQFAMENWTKPRRHAHRIVLNDLWTRNFVFLSI
ncbi:hypothetical protein Golomagni_05340 [Golovinomyces magnicellulatus]|nr:hypothetical protein Golomagni_05340 [Golovinomyces magnicellulatus]